MMHFKTLSFAVFACTLSCFGCDNKNADTSAATSATTVTSASGAGPATAVGAQPISSAQAAALTAQASAMQSAMLAAMDSASPPANSVAPTPTAKIMASAAPSASAAPAPACGTKTNPCPLQAWMQQNANPAVASGDAAQIGVALDQIAKYAPPGYSNWAKIATDGSAAAKSGDVPAAKGACRTCHDQYKAKYKSEMRDRKI